MAEQEVTFVAHFTIVDRDRYKTYVKGFFPLLEAHGGRFRTYDDAVLVLEGNPEDGRTVLIDFDNETQLLNWWNSEEYQILAKIRHESCVTHSVRVVHGSAQ
jgi:uncharacterized protein (DUF1330 family)